MGERIAEELPKISKLACWRRIAKLRKPPGTRELYNMISIGGFV